jgi:hypothetical protein
MDYDFLCRLLNHASVVYTDTTVARFRIHHHSKTTRQAGVGFLLENAKVSRRYWHLLPPGEMESCKRGLTRRLTRRAVRQLLYLRPGAFLLLLRTSLQVGRRETLWNMVREAVRPGEIWAALKRLRHASRLATGEENDH